MNLDLMAVFSSKSAVKTPENKMIKLYIMCMYDKKQKFMFYLPKNISPVHSSVYL
jgi:hypothetical protein